MDKHMKDWVTKKIGDICEFKYGKNLPEITRISGKYPVYGSSSVVSYHNEFYVKGPGIIVGRKGTVGKVQFSKVDFYPIDTTFYVTVDTNKIDIKFMYYLLGLSGLQNMNSDAAVPGLNRSAALSVKVKIPPLVTQTRIAKALSAYDDLIENNLKRIKLLEEIVQITYEEWFVRLRFPGHEDSLTNPKTNLPEGWEVRNIYELYYIKYGKMLPKTKMNVKHEMRIVLINTNFVNAYKYNV
jgi:type I restriction enzyme S subunit